MPCRNAKLPGLGLVALLGVMTTGLHRPKDHRPTLIQLAGLRRKVCPYWSWVAAVEIKHQKPKRHGRRERRARLRWHEPGGLAAPVA